MIEFIFTDRYRFYKSTKINYCISMMGTVLKLEYHCGDDTISREKSDKTYGLICYTFRNGLKTDYSQ